MDEAKQVIDKGRVVAFVTDRFGKRREGCPSLNLDTIEPEDDITISEAFGRHGDAICPHEFGIASNGLAWFLLLTLEMVQQLEWTDFRNPTL